VEKKGGTMELLSLELPMCLRAQGVNERSEKPERSQLDSGYYTHITTTNNTRTKQRWYSHVLKEKINLGKLEGWQ
jgi:hypothetical protein